MTPSAAAPQLLVLAAGLGSRFGGLKQATPVGPAGELLMDYTVFDAWRAGVDSLVVVLRREMETDFHALHGRRWAARLDVAYAWQEANDLPSGSPPLGAARQKPWGTGHAVWAARRAIRRSFLVANADDFYGSGSIASLVAFLAAHPRPEALAMVGYPLAETLSPRGPVSRGVCAVGADGRLARITEISEITESEGAPRATPPAGGVALTGREPVSMNLWALRPTLFARLETGFAAFLARRGGDPAAEYFLPTAVQAEIDGGRATVDVLPARERWFGVTHPDDLALARARLAELAADGTYPPALWS